jgi:CRISPR-associated endonuclease Cas2
MSESAYVFAYDITSEKRRGGVLKCLKRWRVDGQYSVHETWLKSFQVRDLSGELLGLIDRDEDSLLVCRLSARHASPVFQVQHQKKAAPLAGKPRSAPLPGKLAAGWYLFCYDIRENRRLQRIQRVTAKRAYYLQRSVYLYNGGGAELLKLADKVAELMQDDDDLRIYALGDPRDIWFLSNDRPPLPQIGRPQPQPQAQSKPSLWRKVTGWFKQ